VEGGLPYTILLVDDSPMIRRLLRFLIEHNTDWHVCGEAENGKAAVEQVEQLHPDLVILDFQMPVMNGLEAAQQISQLAPNTAMVMFPCTTPSSFATRLKPPEFATLSLKPTASPST
jgi:YesN/AraC family two-component response regulator